MNDAMAVMFVVGGSTLALIYILFDIANKLNEILDLLKKEKAE